MTSLHHTSLHRRWLGGTVAGIQAASKVLAIVGALIVLAMLVATAADIALRNTVGRPVPGVFEYTEIALATIVFLGLPYTMQVGGHVAIDSLTSRLPSAWRHYVEAGALAVTLPFVLWLAVASVGVAWDSFVSREVRFGVVQAPVWPARMVIPLGAGLLAAEITITITRLLKRGPQNGQPESRLSEMI
jgi:TRAP-type C4-dicarboxylate transport system permease small subunit